MNYERNSTQSNNFELSKVRKFIVSCFVFVVFFACTKTTENTYSITFESNGATIGAPANLTNQTQLTAFLAGTPLKTGYTFDGWYEDTPFKNKVVFPLTLTKNTTIYAKWINEKGILRTATINGKTYKTTTIGNQTWMAENLNDAGHTAGISSTYDQNNEYLTASKKDCIASVLS